MRQSSDASAGIEILGTTRRQTEHPAVTWGCGGAGYRGNVSEGRNFAPSTRGPDCTATYLLRLPPWWVMPTTWGMMAIGAATVALALLL